MASKSLLPAFASRAEASAANSAAQAIASGCFIRKGPWRGRSAAPCGDERNRCGENRAPESRRDGHSLNFDRNAVATTFLTHLLAFKAGFHERWLSNDTASKPHANKQHARTRRAEGSTPWPEP